LIIENFDFTRGVECGWRAWPQYPRWTALNIMEVVRERDLALRYLSIPRLGKLEKAGTGPESGYR
jgi:hypothetical protein